MTKTTPILTLLLALAASTLTGCGGGGDGDDSKSGSPTSATTINQFSVAGNGTTPATASEVSVSRSSGAFSVTWDVKSSDPYRVDAYISSDTNVSSNDAQFIGSNCGSLSAIYTCGSQKTAQCSITASTGSPATYSVQCSNTGGASSRGNLGAITLPYTANVVLKACNGLFDSCKTVSQSITFTP